MLANDLKPAIGSNQHQVLLLQANVHPHLAAHIVKAIEKLGSMLSENPENCPDRAPITLLDRQNALYKFVSICYRRRSVENGT